MPLCVIAPASLGLINKEHTFPCDTMQFVRLSAIITASVISLISGFHPRAIATDPDYLCFLTTNSGEVVNLSESLCGSKTSKFGSAKDQKFVDAYKNLAMKYPDVRDNLIGNIQRSPEENIQQAKSVCNDLQSGLSLDEIAEDRAEEQTERVGSINVGIINNLATKYYCPEFNN